ncbi:hypothetical protein D9Q98_000635 [Chlorella vulgaris]|uniref:Uncharacterized protein n=1 Tax=Chlorella vulgaris TaxID=3077 RepID=A0A9D4TYN6_CHLVU|nr:hypothetical protein D9Q98_000635 [Chlorella vulgaris]
MALRSAVRSLGQWSRAAGQQQWADSIAGALAPAKAQAQALCTQSTAAAAASAWQRATGRHLPGAAATLARGSSRCCSMGAAEGAAVVGLRSYSSSTRETLQQAAHRIKSAAASSADALKAAGRVAGRAPGALYQVLPASAKQLVKATQTPGAVNRVISLQLTAFWQNHNKAIVGTGAALLCYLLWRAMYRTSQAFISLSETAAASGFLALAAAAVAFGYLYLRRRFTVDSKSVYRQAMYRLNTHPGLLEVMGAPLAGSPVQASVLTGGTIRFKGLRPKLQSKRIQMIFPLKGSERRGLVSLEAKKRHGQLRFKLLAVDVPSVSGGEQRIFLEGGPGLYERGGVLDVLRDPFIKALSMEDVFMAEDEAEDAEEWRQADAAAAAQQAKAAARAPKPLDQGGGMYFHERVWLGARRAWAKLIPKQQKVETALAPVGGAAETAAQAAPVASLTPAAQEPAPAARTA